MGKEFAGAGLWATPIAVPTTLAGLLGLGALMVLSGATQPATSLAHGPVDRDQSAQTDVRCARLSGHGKRWMRNASNRPDLLMDILSAPPKKN